MLDYNQAANLHLQLKAALDLAFSQYRNFAVAQLCDALKASAYNLQFSNELTYSSLEISCGSLGVIAAFGYRNPCMDFEWVTPALPESLS
jgi:hypothetical protein